MITSEITFLDAWKKCRPWCPVKLYWNEELVWDDEVDIDKWVTPEKAFEAFAEKHPDYKKYIVTNIEMVVVSYHHTIVHMFGSIEV